MTRRFLALACALALAGFLASSSPIQAQSPHQDTPASASEIRNHQQQDERILILLQETIVDADYDRVDLEKVIDDLRQRFDLNIHVSWPALEAIGVRRDRRIEVHLRQISLATLLDIILRESADATERPTYHVENGVLILTTGEATREQTVLRAYDIADLIESGYAIRRFANTPVLGMELTGREFIGGEEKRQRTGGGGGGVGGGGSVFDDPEEPPQRLTELERIQEVIDLLLDAIDPESWQDAGGATGSIRSFNSTLLIRHSLRTHQQIAAFLDMLRASRPRALDGDAMIVRLRADKAAELRATLRDSFPRLSQKQMSEWADAIAAPESVLFRASTRGFNGQRMWFSALRQRDMLTGADPVVGHQVSAYRPITEVATSGLELIVLPLAQPDSEEMTLDVQMAWVPDPAVLPRAAALGAAGEQSTLDQTTRAMRTISTATRLTLGEAIVLSIPNQPSDKGLAAEWEEWLIVLVRGDGSGG